MSVSFFASSLAQFQKSLISFCRKLKLYEEQELTMQVFSEPEISQIENVNDVTEQSERRDSYEVSQIGDNTYATILPRNLSLAMANSSNETNGTVRSLRMPSNSAVSIIGNADVADYATLRNVSRAPSTVSLVRRITHPNSNSRLIFALLFYSYSNSPDRRFKRSPKIRMEIMWLK